MTPTDRGTVWALARLGLVVLALVAGAAWWALQGGGTFRVEQRLRLAPDHEAETITGLPLNGEPRDCWRVKAGKGLRFHVVVPGPDAALRFREGFLQGKPDVAVRLHHADGLTTEVASMHATESAWGERRVELPVHPGEPVDVELLALDGRGHPGHGEVYLTDVVLESRGREVEVARHPVGERAVQADLLAPVAVDMRSAPASREQRRVDLPGPICLPLSSRAPVPFEVDRVPADARLHVVLHTGPLSEAVRHQAGVVRILTGERVLGSVPIVQDDDQPHGDWLADFDLSWAAERMLPLRFELAGADGAFVGLRELYLSAPRLVERREQRPEESLNVLLVVAHGLRPDRLGAWGYQRGHTPVLDALAARGLRYANAFAPSSWSLPNLATFLTGHTPLVHGLGLAPQRVLSPRLTTLAQSAAWSGVSTAAVAAGQELTPATGLERGYEHLVTGNLTADQVAEAALDWLAEGLQYEWFLTLVFNDALHPYEPTNQDLMLVDRELDQGLVERLRPLDSRPGAAESVALEIGPLYDAEVAGIDRALGRVLDAVEQAGQLERTLVVVVGTHGAEFFEHGGRLEGQTLHDEVVRVPVLLAGPRIGRAQAPPYVETEAVELADITRLVGELGRLLAPAGQSARLPAPFGARAVDPALHSVLRPIHPITRRNIEATRRGRWLRMVDVLTGAEVLYDLEVDPYARVDQLSSADALTASEARTVADGLADAFDSWSVDEILRAASQPRRVVTGSTP